MLTAELLRALGEAHHRERADATILSAEPPDPRLYGRVVRRPDGSVLKIVEGTDATDEEQRIREINSSIYVFRSSALWPALERLEPKNVQGELYLTDAIELIVRDGGKVAAHVAADHRETDGVNTRVELAQAAAVLRDRINEAHMLAGVTIVDPATTWIEPTVEIEADATIQPFTLLRGATRVATGAEIGANTVAIDAHIGRSATVGPFCYLRPGTVLGESSKAGTYVEIKNSRIGDRTKVPHLSYIGDAEIGEDTNIGAGAITANFPHKPGRPKGRTTIGSNVRTGIHNGFVAPIEVGDGAWIAAGSVITKDVPPDALAVSRPRQENKEGYAARQRDL
jgi:bifunctional UDP-N-acetylglucosamine pyrophosphorylase/glucosamine-1-phosphate N-acetyltransferase